MKALITGAAGGMGVAYAKALAAKGYDLMLSDQYIDKLKNPAAYLKEHFGVSVELVQVNLASKNDVAEFARQVGAKEIDMLVHTAGYSESALFYEESIEDALNMMNVHIGALIELTHAVLPGMLQRRSGTIIAISSLGAFLPAPGSSIYSATKSFINTFMEALYMETSAKGILVQSVCPGLIDTGFHSKEHKTVFNKINWLNIWMQADDVVSLSLKNLNTTRAIYIPGVKNKVLRIIIALLPKPLLYKLLTTKMAQDTTPAGSI